MVQKSATKSTNTKLWLAIVALLLLQAATISYLIKSHLDQQAASKTSLNKTINDYELNRYTAPVIDISEGRVYIPENRVFLPLNDTSRKLLYYNNSAQPDNKNLYLSLVGVVGHQLNTDDPSCDRMLRISASKDRFDNEKLVSEIKPTKDGLRYIFQNTNHCSIYSQDTIDHLAELAKQMQRY